MPRLADYLGPNGPCPVRPFCKLAGRQARPQRPPDVAVCCGKRDFRERGRPPRGEGRTHGFRGWGGREAIQPVLPARPARCFVILRKRVGGGDAQRLWRGGRGELRTCAENRGDEAIRIRGRGLGLPTIRQRASICFRKSAPGLSRPGSRPRRLAEAPLPDVIMSHLKRNARWCDMGRSRPTSRR